MSHRLVFPSPACRALRLSLLAGQSPKRAGLFCFLACKVETFPFPAATAGRRQGGYLDSCSGAPPTHTHVFFPGSRSFSLKHEGREEARRWWEKLFARGVASLQRGKRRY